MNIRIVLVGYFNLIQNDQKKLEQYLSEDFNLELENYHSLVVVSF